MNKKLQEYFSLIEQYQLSKQLLRQSIKVCAERSIRRSEHDPFSHDPNNERVSINSLWGTQRLLMITDHDPSLDDLAAHAILHKRTVTLVWSRPNLGVLKSRPVDPNCQDLVAESAWIVYNALSVLAKGFRVPPCEQVTELQVHEKVCALDTMDSIVSAGLYYGWQPFIQMKSVRD